MLLNPVATCEKPAVQMLGPNSLSARQSARLLWNVGTRAGKRAEPATEIMLAERNAKGSSFVGTFATEIATPDHAVHVKDNAK